MSGGRAVLTPGTGGHPAAVSQHHPYQEVRPVGDQITSPASPVLTAFNRAVVRWADAQDFSGHRNREQLRNFLLLAGFSCDISTLSVTLSRAALTGKSKRMGHGVRPVSDGAFVNQRRTLASLGVLKSESGQCPGQPDSANTIFPQFDTRLTAAGTLAPYDFWAADDANLHTGESTDDANLHTDLHTQVAHPTRAGFLELRSELGSYAGAAAGEESSVQPSQPDDDANAAIARADETPKSNPGPDGDHPEVGQATGVDGLII